MGGLSPSNQCPANCRVCVEIVPCRNCVRVSRRFRLAHEIQAKGLGLKSYVLIIGQSFVAKGRLGEAVNMNYSGLSVVPAPVILT